MTRKAAIRFLATLIPGIPAIAYGQSKLMELSFGKPKTNSNPWEVTQYKPGTATATLHLEAFDHFTVTNGSESRVATITRWELWKALSDDPPHNNECPVCGKMAPAYHPVKECCTSLCYPEHMRCDPDSNMVRCSHCNTVFVQDAEGSK
jgi:hypothetical protein